MVEAAANDPLGLVGKLLDRKYRVDARVAEGGFGVVYAGQHIGLGAPLAIKVLKSVPYATVAERGEMVAHFLEEARLIAKLRHPAVVGVMDVGVTPTEQHPEGLPWIVMEWLDGETLAANLARRRAEGVGGRTRAETLELLRPVVEAVAEAHAAGIVHRDLNPNNIMLVPGPPGTSARVLDFGIAKVMRADALPSIRDTAPDTVRAFSLAYAAPEQLSGKRTGPWTDVYALGLLFTEVLCGHRSLSVDGILDYHRAAFDPTRPTPLSLGVYAGEWEAILARALALNPQDRHASAGELLAALDGMRSAEMPSKTATTREQRRGTNDLSPNADSDTAPRARARWRFTRRIALTAIVVAFLAVAAASVLVLRATAKCTSNAACNKPGAPAICRPDVGCVALRSKDCEPFADDRALESDDTVWFGTMFPRTGPDGPAFGELETNAVELARRDFAQIMGGASAAGTLERARPFGLVACDDAANYQRAANHLVNAVGVPAVIGFYKSLEAIELTTTLFLDQRVLAIASTNTNPLVTASRPLDGLPRLVWRTTYNSANAAGALSALLAEMLEPSLRGPDGGLGHRPMRVALIRPRDAAGQALSDEFSRKLRFNGMTVLANASNYLESTLEAEAPITSPEYARLRVDLLAFAPDVILYANGPAIVEGLFEPLEKQWPPGVPRRPVYVSIATLAQEALDFIGMNQDRRSRFFAVTTVGSTDTNARFVTHFNETFSDKVTRTFGPNTSYDAFYLLAYATYTIPKREKVTGERLARGFGKLVPPGRPVEVGLAEIFDAYDALSKSESIDLIGAAGRLDLDLTTGESAFDLAVLCVGVDERGKAGVIESGLVYSAVSKKLEGTMRCP
jgi:serine/threonine protein kinase/ABC-type branched-subunit amino acid transport system substrate-binding protein